MRDILVLCYHAVSERWPAALTVTAAQLEAQLRYLILRGYRATTFTNALTSPRSGRTLVVTFDDAYRSVFARAFPILSRLGLPATIFVPTAFAGTEQPMCWPGIDEWIGGPYEGEMIPLTWTQLRELAAAGWEVGSHSRTHPRLTRLDDAALEHELRGAKEECEQHLDQPCTSIAYPFGDVDARVVAAVARAGYETGATVESVVPEARRLTWPRFAVSREDSFARFRRQASPTVRRLQTTSAGAAGTRAYAAALAALRRPRG